jgi:membrane protein DedA with SNARE-associated domain
VPSVPGTNTEKLREKKTRLFIIAVAAAFVVIVLLDVLEDALVEGGPVTVQPLNEFLSVVAAFTQNVTETVSSWGYAGIFSLMLLESSSLPVPSEVILPFAGYLVSSGVLNFWMVVVVSTIAGLAGSLIDYYIGLKGMAFLMKHVPDSKFPLNRQRLETATRWFNKYGTEIIFLGRLVPGFRTLISFPAGAAKMSMPKFVGYTLSGCLLWNGLLVYAGFYLSANWRDVAEISRFLIIAALALIVLALLVFVARKRKTKTEA